MTECVIIGAKRTPLGNFLGELSSLSASQLGAKAIEAAIAETSVDATKIEEVIMGNVLSAGQGQSPARQALIAAGLPKGTASLTINKMCGSGTRALMLASDSIKAGSASCVVAGGMESMSNAPYLIPASARKGMRFGDFKTFDHMMLDGLTDAYSHLSMGVYAQETADEYAFSREAMDDFAISSLTKAKESQAHDAYSNEVVPIEIVDRRKNTTVIANDELPRTARIEKIPSLRPAFTKDGTVTAANSSSISDGAAALVVASSEFAKANQCTPLARIVAYTSYGREPERFTLAPVGAMHALFEQTGWSVDSVDLFEINEAFATVTMAAMKDFSIPAEKVNIAGGACAIGHPIGASGARIVVSLIRALQRQNKKRGVAAICIGGGEANAMAIELI